MRILLQDATTGLYLNSRRNWTPRQQEALAFRDEVRARDYSLYHGLVRAVVVRVPDRNSSAPSNSSAIPRMPTKEQPQVDLPMKTTIWSTRQAAGQLVFKVLLNDARWSAGDNYAVEAGQRIEVAPQF